ncbi:CtsR family transcriptional regulator [Herbivorax sp. ANBcel31]|uniref:CtsR family transcriptional regulator n=1 Tax=Herbivorax sp. ANBcel31 TaxID=3069754 RepID=UPI0027B4F7AD|nr:CtsR family transcriptional regulator [Herbivorax sp. ANBcel31]MDQ2084891.1 CtsR family transcriptional regulator [Herbivorax sp. ANBcel31]
MAKLSDLIEAFIKQLINDTDGYIEIQRNELANQFKCVPSQINYVIDTRFTSDRGYYVESRRGGGGHIRIKRVSIRHKDKNHLMHVVTSIGDNISQQIAQAFINNFIDYNIISEKEGLMLKAATSDKVLATVPREQRGFLRANILKNMLVCLLM